MNRIVCAAVVVAAACRAPAAPTPGTFVGSLARVQLDTIDIAVPVAAASCRDSVPGGVVVEGAERGSGVLVWLSAAGPDSGAYPIAHPADSLTTVHARVTLHYRTGEVAHTLVLDSGTVRVDRAVGAISGAVAGSGHDPSGGLRPLLHGSFVAVPFATDSVPCRTRL